jgi:hypothetical protein
MAADYTSTLNVAVLIAESPKHGFMTACPEQCKVPYSALFVLQSCAHLKF